MFGGWTLLLRKFESWEMSTLQWGLRLCSPLRREATQGKAWRAARRFQVGGERLRFFWGGEKEREGETGGGDKD